MTTNELIEAVELTEALRAKFARRLELVVKKAEVIDAIDAIDEEIKAFMGENPLATINGVPVISYKNVESSRFDLTTAKGILSEQVLQSCYKTSSTRVFRMVDSK